MADSICRSTILPNTTGAVYCGRQGDFNFSNWPRRVSKFLTRVKYAMKVILIES
jgi:hypothetical protein